MSDHTEIRENDRRADMGLHPVANEPASPMAQAMYTLQDEISEMGRILDDLANTISPIVGPDLNDSSAAPSSNPMSHHSSLVVNVVDQASRIRDQRVALQQLIKRVEL